MIQSEKNATTRARPNSIQLQYLYLRLLLAVLWRKYILRGITVDW